MRSDSVAPLISCSSLALLASLTDRPPFRTTLFSILYNLSEKSDKHSPCYWCIALNVRYSSSPDSEVPKVLSSAYMIRLAMGLDLHTA